MLLVSKSINRPFQQNERMEGMIVEVLKGAEERKFLMVFVVGAFDLELDVAGGLETSGHSFLIVPHRF